MQLPPSPFTALAALSHCFLQSEDVYEHPKYDGENVLHMCVAQRDEEEARFICQLRPQLIHGKATGSFFLLGDNAYYGSSPLCFAVSTNQPSLVRFLVCEMGASIWQQDIYGNTAAHL